MLYPVKYEKKHNWVQHTEAVELAQWCDSNLLNGWWIEGSLEPNEGRLLIHFEDEDDLCLFKLRWGIGTSED